jgi:biotin synthase-related radical SAM superfamily protein
MEDGLTPLEKKAILILGGAVRIPRDMHLGFKPSRSTAGPGAGSATFVVSFEGMRVKKAFDREEGEFQLVQENERLSLLRNGRPFIPEVRISPALFHSPEQAFFNLEQACIYRCAFCTSPRLGKDVLKDLTPDKVVDMIVEASRGPDLKAVAITSAVSKDPSETVQKMAYVVREVRRRLGPGMPIGVEPYVSRLEQIDLLKGAGADEIKLNIETFDRGIFVRVCGEQDIDWIILALEHAVKVFGRGKVTTNIIIGMGESDDNVLQGVEAMAEIGVVPSLRPLRINDINRGPLRAAIGDVPPLTCERLLRLNHAAKAILERHGLSTLTYRTMCHECGCCDLVPFRDF